MKKKTIIVLILVLIFLGSLAFGVVQMMNDPEVYNHDPNVDKIMNACNVSKEQATEIWNIMKECGVGGIRSITYDPLLDGVYADTDLGFRVETKGNTKPILYLNEQGEVHLFRYAGEVLYSNE